jgi:hypothetical protein
MRASPRKRAPGGGSPTRAAARRGAVALAVALGCAGWMAGAASAAASTEASAVAAAKQAAARAEARAVKQDAAAGTIAAAPAPTKTAAAVKPAAGAKSATQKKPAAPVKTVAAAKPATRAPQAGKTPAGQGRGGVAAVAASMRPTMSPVPSASPSVARLDDQVTYQYNALGRRDPFMPLVGGRQYVPIEAPPDIGGLQVVGVVWGAQDKFAIVEDGRGNSTVLRPGDKVMNGVVQGLKRDGVIVDLAVDGQTQSVTIPLTRKGEPNANR